MSIYLDVSCLNRPFDDQRQDRVRLEAEAVLLILKRIEEGELALVSSEVVELEVNAIPDEERRERVALILPPLDVRGILSQESLSRSAELERLGFKPADALHVAAAEQSQVEILLSCDDRLCRAARRNQDKIRIRVMNPLQWLQEQDNVAND